MKTLLMLTLAAVLNDLFYFAAFRFTTVANAALAHQMVSVFLVLLVPWLLGEQILKSEWRSLILSLLGLVFIYASGLDLGGARGLIGITLGLASAFCYAFVVVYYRKLGQLGLSILVVNFWRFLLSTILLLPVCTFFGGFKINLIDLLPLACFGLLFAWLAAGIHTYALSIARPLHSSILGKVEPVVATIYAFLFLSENPSLNVIIGGILIIASSVWLTLRTEKE